MCVLELVVLSPPVAVGMVPSDYWVRLLSILHRLRLTKEVTGIIVKPSLAVFCLLPWQHFVILYLSSIYNHKTSTKLATSCSLWTLVGGGRVRE